MFHARKAPPLADGLIKRIVALGCAEHRYIIFAKSADHIRRKRNLAHRLENKFFARSGRALRCRVKSTDCFQRITEKIQSYRLFGARSKEVENAPAHGIFSNVSD